ncbi:MAG TPA: hypothetical protein VFK90_01590 [Anaeromyxobacter sp.]|nr:hypothetical protein [Anaeromyxobacter sp.]
MRKLIEKLANVMAAVAFAEENDAETARELLADADREERSEAPAPRAPALPRARKLAKSS